ncbi:hypothetical protein LUZ61_012415 [Rhynchospora tenuis]|uniref:Uncharacterized protein n=1 Tax=Rhynchospora tenuis TaxID=198213 RepID=A0AAD6A316_9POAL|nr:hypothetical protein LUZ61_012415 [Rhynchospora tenuis]
MEGAALEFALGKLKVLLDMGLNMGLEMYSVSDEITHIQLALRMISCFLQDAHSKRNKKMAAKQWVNEIRDVAYRIEDAVDTFLVDIEDNRARNSGVWSKLARLKKPLKVKDLVDEVKSIRSTIETISQLRIQLGITDDSVSGPQLERELFRPAGPSDVNDLEVVGFDRDKDQIISKLLDTNISRLAVLSIVGMGGLGKTTLAQKVYKSDKKLKGEGRFDCLIWLSISQKFDVQNLLREILFSVEPNMQKENPTISQEDLTRKLGESLYQRRYLIVLDDVWTIDLWESLRKALPDENNASRVLITTRQEDVAKAACGDLYELGYLNELDSLNLLFRKVNIPLRSQHRTDLNDVARQLTKKCDGLPLALIVLGSILSRRERTLKAWQRVHETLDWHDERAKRCSQVLLLSYVELPYHLKPFFLYFASFPEDYEISAKHIIRMWIAEGFIPSVGNGTMEERAQNILEDLLQRSLVQVIEKSGDGKCKTCRVHDLVRDMAIHEAMEENFFTVFTKEDDEIQFSAQKVRRATLQCSPPTNFGMHSNNARSLLIFRPYEYKLNIGEIRLLKVLSFDGVDFRRNKIIHKGWLEGLIHLRYLSFRNCRLPFEFPSIYFSNLKNIETVDFRETFINYPDEEYCYIVHYSQQGKVVSSFPSKGNHLKNIQKLKLNLLGSSRSSSIKERWKNLKAMLTRTKHLISFAILADYLPLLSKFTRGLSCHETIQSLYLGGRWKRDMCVLNLEMFPTNLTKLTLEGSDFEEDPMPILEMLQSLTVLRLRYKSFMGTKLTCTEGGFPSLQKLELRSLHNVSHWDIKERAMPKLTHLKMVDLINLGVLPELQNVQTLHNLELGKGLYEKSGQPENHHKIQHILSVRKVEW